MSDASDYHVDGELVSLFLKLDVIFPIWKCTCDVHATPTEIPLE